MPLPQAFVAQMQAQLGTESVPFFEVLATQPPISIRLNPRKKANLKLAYAKPVEWCADAYYLAGERPVFTLDPAFHAGAYYVQEAASMFLQTVLSQILPKNTPPLSILDLCAAPGGKTTLLAANVPENAFVLGNEVIRTRVEILKENLTKWGYPNTYAANHDPEDFAPLGGFFDIVLTDAPCSGEGLFRKDEKAANEWSPESVQMCSARQRRILAAAMNVVKNDGFLIFSTCTYNDIENLESLDFIAQNNDFQSFKINLNNSNIVEKISKSGAKGYQFYPHRTEGEGFFIAIFQRKNGALPPPSVSRLKFEKLAKKQEEIAQKWLKNPDDFNFFVKPNGTVFVVLKEHLPYIALIDNVLQKKSIGLEIGTFKGNDFIPTHNLALSTAVSDTITRIEFSQRDALLFLKKENIDLDDAPQGWALACYEGLPLGFMKVLQNRINNYLPKDFRIRMSID